MWVFFKMDKTSTFPYLSWATALLSERRQFLKWLAERIEELGLENSLKVFVEEDLLLHSNTGESLQDRALNTLKITGRAPSLKTGALTVLKTELRQRVCDAEFEATTGVSIGEKMPTLATLPEPFSLVPQKTLTLVLLWAWFSDASVSAVHALKKLLEDRAENYQMDLCFISLDTSHQEWARARNSTEVNSLFSKTQVRHLWCGPESWESDTVKILGVSSIPTFFLVDNRDRTVLFMGHPSLNANGLSYHLDQMLLGQKSLSPDPDEAPKKNLNLPQKSLSPKKNLPTSAERLRGLVKQNNFDKDLYFQAQNQGGSNSLWFSLTSAQRKNVRSTIKTLLGHFPLLKAYACARIETSEAFFFGGATHEVAQTCTIFVTNSRLTPSTITERTDFQDQVFAFLEDLRREFPGLSSDM